MKHLPHTVYSYCAGLCIFIMTVPVMAAPEVNTVMGAGTGESDIAGNLIQTTLGLIVILAMIAGAAWLAKRFGNFKVGAQGRMKIVGGLSVGTRERVVLLQVGEQQLLVGVAPGRIQTLHVLDEALPVESTHVDNPKNAFAEKLNAALGMARGNRS